MMITARRLRLEIISDARFIIRVSHGGVSFNSDLAPPRGDAGRVALT
jgi:hypothetical protein